MMYFEMVYRKVFLSNINPLRFNTNITALLKDFTPWKRQKHVIAKLHSYKIVKLVSYSKHKGVRSEIQNCSNPPIRGCVLHLVIHACYDIIQLLFAVWKISCGAVAYVTALSQCSSMNPFYFMASYISITSIQRSH